MNRTTLIKKIGTIAYAVLAVMFLFTSCDHVLYEDEGDCDITYRLKFRYDWNMNFADAFSHEVKSIKLYAFNTEGKLVWQTTESGDKLAKDDYSILLPLNPGNYRLMAWCGLDNGESFTVPEIGEGDSYKGLHCKLNREYDNGHACSKNDLHALFHGTIEVDLPASDDGEDYVYTMPLIKDTNIIRVVLQHLSGEDINHKDFTFRIEDNNGWMAYDNALIDDEPLTYHAWSTYSGTAGVDQASGKAITNVRVAIAEFTVSRLVLRDWSIVNKPMLVIRKAADGELVARIPVIDYALLVKGKHNRSMDDQEYLDRQDEYNMTFFLDEHNRWLSTVVIINSWRIVLNPTDLSN